MARKNVTNVVFSNTRNANLNWSLKVVFSTTFGCRSITLLCGTDNIPWKYSRIFFLTFNVNVGIFKIIMWIIVIPTEHCYGFE